MMNPGPVEEVGKATNTFMEIMRTQPLALALVICNLVLLGLFFYVANLASGNRRHEFELVLDAQKKVQELLFNCVPHDKSIPFKLQSDESHPFPLPPEKPK